MEKELEKKLAEAVRKKLAVSLKQFDFKRTKSTFFTKMKSDRVDFIHLHKFTFGPSFRVHIGSRFLCDTFDAVALNGFSSDSFRPKYKFDYDENEESVNICVDEMIDFIQNNGFKWFDDWSNPIKLLNSSESPITSFKNDYVKFCNGVINKEILNVSYKLMGIKIQA